MRKIKIKEGGYFYYGSCAILSIAGAFKIPTDTLKVIIHLIGYKDLYDGLSYTQCVKIIRRLSIEYGCMYCYRPNTANITYLQLLLLFPDRTIIPMFSAHLSLAINGAIYDSFLKGSPTLTKNYLNTKPTGWWIIK